MQRATVLAARDLRLGTAGGGERLIRQHRDEGV